jgi:hypothetical protein
VTGQFEHGIGPLGSIKDSNCLSRRAAVSCSRRTVLRVLVVYPRGRPSVADLCEEE